MLLCSLLSVTVVQNSVPKALVFVRFLYFISPYSDEKSVLVSDLFVDGKPRVRGADQVGRWTGDLTKKAIGGHELVGTFMTSFSFPLVVKTSHLAQMREDIARNVGKATFEEAFHTICDGSKKRYSQFDIMFNYLWYHKRDEYFWNIARVEDGEFGNLATKRTT